MGKERESAGARWSLKQAKRLLAFMRAGQAGTSRETHGEK